MKLVFPGKEVRGGCNTFYSLQNIGDDVVARLIGDGELFFDSANPDGAILLDVGLIILAPNSNRQ
jgi:hypothetical protein